MIINHSQLLAIIKPSLPLLSMLKQYNIVRTQLMDTEPYCSEETSLIVQGETRRGPSMVSILINSTTCFSMAGVISIEATSKRTVVRCHKFQQDVATMTGFSDLSGLPRFAGELSPLQGEAVNR